MQLQEHRYTIRKGGNQESEEGYMLEKKCEIIINRQKVCDAFIRYVKQYNMEDEKIRLKAEHTYRVSDLCERIAKSLTLEQAEVDLAWLLGMLHDIGRFEQVRRYGTFSDAMSVDHAQFGADLLFREGLLDIFVPGYQVQMTEDEIRILEISIRNHSGFRLPESLRDIERDYCNLLRDADKIDIFRVNCDTPMEDIYNVSSEELKQARVSDEVKECFKNRTAVFRPLRKTAVDYLVGHICLVFELQYPISRKIAREQGYLDRMLEFRSCDPETQAWFEYMKQTLQTFG